MRGADSRRSSAARASRAAPGVQPPAPSAASLPGVHSFSRAFACSTLIGLASLDQQLDRLAAGEVARAARSSRPALRSCSSSFSAVVPSRSAAGASASSELLVGRLDLLGLDDRRDHRLAPQRARGLGLGLVGELLLLLAGDLQVRLLGDPLARRASTASPRASRAPARGRACRASRPRASATAASSTASLELALDRVLVGLRAAAWRCPRAARRACRTRPPRRRSRRRARAAAWP